MKNAILNAGNDIEFVAELTEGWTSGYLLF